MKDIVKEFKKNCEKYLKENYSSEFSFMFFSKYEIFGHLYLDYLIIHNISDDCKAIYIISFGSDGYIIQHRMVIDSRSSRIIESDFLKGGK